MIPSYARLFKGRAAMTSASFQRETHQWFISRVYAFSAGAVNQQARFPWPFPNRPLPHIDTSTQRRKPRLPRRCLPDSPSSL